MVKYFSCLIQINFCQGSLTLHNWSRLATPHLGGVLEERCGVAIKGNDKAGLDPLFDMYRLEEVSVSRANY